MKGLLRLLQAISCEDYEDIKKTMHVAATKLNRPFEADSVFNGSFGVLRTESMERAKAYYPRLQIKKATWGIGERQVDVADLLSARIDDDRLIVRPLRQTFGVDPAVGLAKLLEIEYTFDGKRSKVTAKENDLAVLLLPERSLET